MTLVAGAPAQLLSAIDLFEHIPDAVLDEIASAATLKEFNKNAYLFHQGDAADQFCLLISGKVKLSQITEEGQQVILRYLSPGEAFAVIAVLSNIPYPVSASAVEQAVILCWGKQCMVDLMERYPRLAINSLSILANQIQEFQDRFRELATERVERRIARSLLRLAKQTGRKADHGVLIDFPLTRQDLAEMTGTTLYTVSRTLSQWERDGLVSSKREQVTLLAPHQLVVIAEEMAS